jgi:hypothetical protein
MKRRCSPSLGRIGTESAQASGTHSGTSRPWAGRTRWPILLNPTRPPRADLSRAAAHVLRLVGHTGWVPDTRQTRQIRQLPKADRQDVRPTVAHGRPRARPPRLRRQGTAKHASRGQKCRPGAAHSNHHFPAPLNRCRLSQFVPLSVLPCGALVADRLAAQRAGYQQVAHDKLLPASAGNPNFRLVTRWMPAQAKRRGHHVIARIYGVEESGGGRPTNQPAARPAPRAPLQCSWRACDLLWRKKFIFFRMPREFMTEDQEETWSNAGARLPGRYQAAKIHFDMGAGGGHRCGTFGSRACGARRLGVRAKAVTGPCRRARSQKQKARRGRSRAGCLRQWCARWHEFEGQSRAERRLSLMASALATVAPDLGGGTRAVRRDPRLALERLQEAYLMVYAGLPA